MAKKKTIFAALRDFADAVTAKMTTLTAGEPEDQLRGPFENFMADVARTLGWKIVCTGETRLPGQLGIPDYALHLNKLLAGYVELKAPGVGANPSRFTGHNRKQWERFRSLPNLLYSDGNEWGLYRSGKIVDKIVRLPGDMATQGKRAADPDAAHALERLLRDFLAWEPIIPTDRKGKIDLKQFAEMLAPLCRMLRDDVTDALQNAGSPLIHLAADWRQLLFPDASDDQFADAYAQTVTFALLLGRSEGANPLTLESAEAALAVQHSLLSRALQMLTDPRARDELSSSLNLLLRVIAVVPPATLAGPKDPWLYFYEDFLAAYDPKLRKNVGAYYTPVEVVRAQVRMIDDLLVNRLGKPLGFAAPDVVTLDPAAGTGTYLLGIIDHALNRIEAEQGAGAVPGQASSIASNLHAFELLVGPFAVAELRVSRALRDRGATLPKDGTHVYLTDTLESPNAKPLVLPFILQPIADQHAKALQVKAKVPVMVCLGNPPYDRHEAVDLKDEKNLSRFGDWVRFGDPLPVNVIKDKRGRERRLKSSKARLEARQRLAILKDFIDPAIAAGHGVHIKNLYNLYVYFWRWALWKVFEHRTDHGPGVVSYISASSYLDGTAFCGMREHMRRLCDEIWILDLGGEGRGTRKSDNVFAIQTPVAIAVALRVGKARKKVPGKVHYARIKEGIREAKLRALDSIHGFTDLEWQDCPDDWQAPFRPAGKGQYFDWPLLTDLMPWQHSGIEFKRTWPIASNADTLERRWRLLLTAGDRNIMFRETGDRLISKSYSVALTPAASSEPISKLPKTEPLPPVYPYGFRSFDRQQIIADGRLISRPRPDLWGTHSQSQIYLASSVVLELGSGPALTCSADIPDRHYFAGRGGKDIIPLYRDADAKKFNIAPGLLELLERIFNLSLSPEDFVAYVYGALAHLAFGVIFAKELGKREVRVPITKDPALFAKVRDAGARLLWLQTYCRRYVPKGKKPGNVPRAEARCVKGVPGDPSDYPEKFWLTEKTQTLHVGQGEFRPVAREVYEFRVSGLMVVQSWLKYRMKKGAGKKSSPLDDIRPERWTSADTTELLKLLWVLEATVEGYPEQAELLEAVVAGPCFNTDELPSVPDEARKPIAGPPPPGSLGL